MSMFRSKASQLIELIIPAGYAANQFFYFQNQPQLQSVRGDRMVYIQAISVYNSNHLTASPLTAGNNVASPTDITNGVLTLNVAGTLLYQQIPLVDLYVRLWITRLRRRWVMRVTMTCFYSVICLKWIGLKAMCRRLPRLRTDLFLICLMSITSGVLWMITRICSVYARGG